MKNFIFWFLFGIGLASIMAATEILLDKSDAYKAHKFLKVAVIDTGLDVHDVRFKHLCKSGHKDFTGTGLKDYNGHGTHITGIIELNTVKDNYCYVILKYYDNKQSELQHSNYSTQAFQYAINIHADIINYSSVGPDFIKDEYNIIYKNPNVIINVAAGNESINIDYFRRFPCSYNLKNINCVGKIKDQEESFNMSNYGKIVKIWEVGYNIMSFLPNGNYGRMTGTSMATAFYTARVLNDLL